MLIPKEQRIPFAVLALILLVCVGVAASFTHPQNDPCESYSQNTRYESYKSCIDSTTTQSVAVYTEVLAYFTVILAFGTIVVAGIGYWQGSLTQQSVDISKRALLDLERPYLLVKRVGWGADSRGALAQITFHNYGRTPANMHELKFFFRVLDHIPTPEDEWPPPDVIFPEEGTPLIVYVGQGEPWQSPETLCWDFFDQQALMAGTKHFYVWGTMQYRDIFRSTHPTNFCRRLNWTNQDWEPAGEWGRNESA